MVLFSTLGTSSSHGKIVYDVPPMDWQNNINSLDYTKDIPLKLAEVLADAWLEACFFWDSGCCYVADVWNFNLVIIL